MGRTLPVTARVLECFDEAVKDGWGARDVTMFPLFSLSLGRGRGEGNYLFQVALSKFSSRL